ncbi:MAG TPA: lysophospholipid acyltransferase family protein [Anaeromyxobacter sp.]
MLARLRGQFVLAVEVLLMVVIFLGSLPIMLVTRSGDLPIWLARYVWAPLGLWLSGARLEIVRAPAPPAGPVIFASNHESALDIWAVFVAIPRSFRFIAKQELFRLPLFGWYLRLGGHIPVDRSNHARAVASLRHAAHVVRGGTSILVFPEGTRSRDGRIQPFKKGSFVIAKDAGVPVIPIAISGSGAVTPSKVVAVHPGTIRIAAGDPIDPARFPDKAALVVEVRRRIIELHRSLGGLGGELEEPAAAPGTGGASRPLSEGAPARPM